jgi:hypothetical protein
MLADTTIQSDKIGLMGMLTLIPSYAEVQIGIMHFWSHLK